MKYFSFLLVALAFACTSNTNDKGTTEAPKADTAEAAVETPKEPVIEAEYMVVSDSSLLTWIGRKPTEFHTGNISVTEGMVAYGEDKILNAAVAVDMNSITVTDIENAEYNAKLVGHLKNEDFFSSDKFPMATFSMNMLQVEDAASGTFSSEGELSIKDISKPINLEGKFLKNGDIITVEGSFVFDRTEYDIKYKSKSFFGDLGDKFIKDEVEVSFKLYCKKMEG